MVVKKQSPATAEQIKKFLDQHTHWSVQNKKLHREYMFADFVSAFKLMTQVAELAEAMNHHPEWFNVYNKLTVDLTTHDAQAITMLDIELASQMEKLSRIIMMSKAVVNKKVLLTGAFGNIGSLVIRELLLQGYNVVAFDKENPVTRKNSKKFADTGIKIFWGDITIKQDIESALQGIDAVIHLAGVFPPLSENNPKLAHAVNVDGTRNIIEMMEKSSTAKRLVFASSIAVYGKQQGRIPPPLKASDSLSPNDHYGKHKAECESMIQSSALQWTLMRISACPPINIANMTSFKGAPIFESHPDSRLEIVHPADAALAFVNAVACDEAIGKILLLGGGEKNQTTTHQMFNTMITSIGLKPLPREAFQIKEPIVFHGDWLDTEESQGLLKFQRHDIQQQHQDFWNSLGPAKHALVLLKPLSPLVSWAIKQSSPYYRNQKSLQKKK